MNLVNFRLPALADKLCPEDLARLRALARRSRYADGQAIHQRGDDTGLSIVVEGRVRLLRRRRDGKQAVIGIWGPGHHFGYGPVAGPSRTHDAQAVGSTTVDHLTGADLERLCAERPAFVRALLDNVLLRQVKLAEAFDDARLSSPAVRLAKLLLMLGGDCRAGDSIACVQEELAQLLGVSSVTLGQLLKQLATAGFISTGYRAVTFRNLAGLRAWVDYEELD